MPTGKWSVDQPRIAGIAAGVATLLIAGVGVYVADRYALDGARARVLTQVVDHANMVKVAVDRALSASYALGATVQQGG